jgi:hypothetical protein
VPAASRGVEDEGRFYLLAGSILGCLVLAGSAGAYSTQQYHNGYCGAHCNPGSGSNYWKTNKVWRPTGNTFAVWFSNCCALTAGYVESADDNPVVTQGEYGYNVGACRNLEGYGVSNVTCQVYSWFA